MKGYTLHSELFFPYKGTKWDRSDYIILGFLVLSLFYLINRVLFRDILSNGVFSCLLPDHIACLDHIVSLPLDLDIEEKLETVSQYIERNKPKETEASDS